MQTISIEMNFLSIFAFITFFIFLAVSKLSHKINNGMLLDNDFLKPQSFHQNAVPRSGGLASIISLSLFYIIFYILFSKILFEYIFVGMSLFAIGYLDDLKLKISPSSRLFLMIFFLLLLIVLLPIKIENIDLTFLNSWMNSFIFSSLFTLLCFLFIVNGANLIDGFNGLLTINLIIINSVLLFINLNNNHHELSFFITAQIIVLITFLLFNFPNAKIFLGDSGSYLFGSLISLNTIATNNLNPHLSSFFFCILLFYLFFEVFFSFLRKIYQNKSPVHPDTEHLHMLSFQQISKVFDKIKGNYINSLLINFVFLCLVLPSIFFADNSLVCKYWFFSLILVYSLFYIRLYRLTKN
tara:strand:+ start:37957 stop:39018 length:1062 start_codon:yes stop_codon:yes gene_type:complete